MTTSYICPYVHCRRPLRSLQGHIGSFIRCDRTFGAVMWKGRARDHDAGGTPKKRGRAIRPWRWGQRQRPWFPRRTLSPAAWRRLWLARQVAGQGTAVRPPFEIFLPPAREGIPETAPSPILRAHSSLSRSSAPRPSLRRRISMCWKSWKLLPLRAHTR
jgi:hypothetical protein